MVKNLPASTGDFKNHGVNPWIGKIPWRKKWQPAPVFLPGKFYGQRSLGLEQLTKLLKTTEQIINETDIQNQQVQF